MENVVNIYYIIIRSFLTSWVDHTLYNYDKSSHMTAQIIHLSTFNINLNDRFSFNDIPKFII